MTYTINKEINFTTTDCCTCGIVFAVSGRFLDQRREDLETFYCPSGHPMVFRKSKAQLLQQDIDRLKLEKEQAEKARFNLHQQLTDKENEVRKLQSSIKRRNKRIFSGVCPCCNRTFKQLAAHMKSKHPELA